MKKKLLYLFGFLVVQVAVVLGTLQYSKNSVEKPVPVPVAGSGDGGYSQTFGWVRDEEVIKENLNPLKTLQFSQTPAGQVVQEVEADRDIYLWRQLRKAAGHGVTEDWYPSVDQKNVGCCVGCGFKHSTDILLGVQVAGGKREEWKPVSVEVIYGLSRVEIGGGRISGDGSVGAWAAKAESTYGVVAMAKYATADLSEFSPTRARQFGKSGVSKELETLAKSHPVKGAALVKTWAEVKKAVSQGYPVAVCSDQGFTMERDSTGKCRPQGTWNHCMAIIAVRGGANEGGFILNSWGKNAHTGPRYPEDMPVEGFWADARVIDRMVRQGDSFALSDAVGFPSRNLPFDWFIFCEPQFKLKRFEVSLR